MTEETKTGNETTGDADQAGKKDATAEGQQGAAQDAAENQDEKYKAAVAMANAEKEKRQAAETEAQNLREQAALAAAARTTPAQTQPQQPLSTYEQAMKDCGVDPEYMTEPERTKVFARMEQLNMARSQQTASAFANQQFESTHPDFNSVVGVRNLYTGQIQPTAEITEILQRKPHLAAAAYSSQGAYQIVMDERKLKKADKEAVAAQEFENQQNADAKTSAMSSAAAGGGGAVSTDKLPRATTAEQQEENDRRVASGEFD